MTPSRFDPVTSPPGKVPSAARALLKALRRSAQELGLFARHVMNHPATLGGGGFGGIAVGGVLASMGHGDRETNQNIGVVIGLVFSTWFMWRTRSDAQRNQSKVTP